MEFEKPTDQNFITQNLHHEKEYCISKKKKLLKQCLKEVIYQYILAFVGWCSIFWEMVGSGGYTLAGGGWWWIYFCWWWVVVGGAGHIFAGGGSWWVVAQFSLTHIIISAILTTKMLKWPFYCVHKTSKMKKG